MGYTIRPLYSPYMGSMSFGLARNIDLSSHEDCWVIPIPKAIYGFRGSELGQQYQPQYYVQYVRSELGACKHCGVPDRDPK